jgi:DNA-directed RNA polymerase specialized sigma24 family protein
VTTELEQADLDSLVPLIGAGSMEAFGRWMAGAEGRVTESLRSFAARVDTEAVLQETLLRVWQVAPRFVPDGKRDGLVRLAVRIARNLAVSELRRSRLDPVEEAAHEASCTAILGQGNIAPLLPRPACVTK